VVTFDAVGPSSSGAANGGTSPLTWSHTNGATADYLLAGFALDGSSGITPANNPFSSVTYNGVSMGSSLLNWQSGGSGEAAGYLGVYALASPATGSALTVSGSFTTTGTDGAEGGSLSFITGGGSVGTAQHFDSGGSLAGSGSISISTTSASSLVAVFMVNGSGGTSWTAGTSRIVGTHTGTAAGAAWTVSAATIAGTGGNVTVSWTQNGDLWAAIAVEVLPPAAGGVTYVPPRYGWAAPPSSAPWSQRDRRDANTVATAANPLVTPLDTAWQADGRYSHLYGDSHLRDRRAYFYQRNYISPPGLLATAELENELLGGAGTPQRYGSAAYYDRREVPQQRAYVSDPLLLTTAQLENELLGGAQTWIRYVTAAYYDRREVPQQRPYISDPSFYPSSAPTDPLTVAWGAGGNYWHLYNRASGITDRREVPQQRLYVSDPLLLTTAQLENELLGGAETGKYYRTPATHAARWWMPQQPARLADPLLIATALLENELLGGADTIRHYLAAAYWDRREVPQQRPYISDPSFYPSGAVTDPLTVAWGAGGPYWHLYNRAADVTDRREVPQQRAYVSDPLLLATALLENELLGGGGTAMRYLAPATHYDRRQAGQQRAYPAAPDIPFNPVLAAWAEGLRRALLAATHADRRLYPQQRVYFPPPAPPPPFTVGLLTALTAPGSALTAADTALGILTAVTAASGATDTTAP
jgi:hypothetical protein